MADDKKKEDFVKGFKDATGGPDISGMVKKASDVLKAGVSAVGDAASAVGSAATSLFDDKNDSGGFLGDKDRYKTAKKK